MEKRKIAVALILMLTITSMSMFCFPATKAAVTCDTFAYLSVRPNPVGVGQALLLNFWITPAFTNPLHAHNYTIQITDPDGKVVTLGPMEAAAEDNTQWLEYVPDKLGTWKFQFVYAGETILAGTQLTSGTVGNTVIYLPSQSRVTTVIVQEEPIPTWPAAPLPTDYWTRPISCENREWYSISGDWMTGNYDAGNSQFNPYSAGPESAHILWMKQTSAGGLVGGITTADQYGQNAEYTGGTAPAVLSITIAGLGFYTETRPASGSRTRTHCVDLHTGEELWVRTDVSFSFAQNEKLLYTSNFGYTPYLVSVSGNRLIKWDAWTGDLAVNISLPSGLSSNLYDDPYIYSVQTNGTQRYLIKWNITGTSTNFTSRIAYNVTYALSGVTRISDDVGIYFGIGLPGLPGAGPSSTTCGGFDTKTGQLLWIRNFTENERPYSTSALSMANGIFVYPAYWPNLAQPQVT